MQLKIKIRPFNAGHSQSKGCDLCFSRNQPIAKRAQRTNVFDAGYRMRNRCVLLKLLRKGRFHLRAVLVPHTILQSMARMPSKCCSAEDSFSGSTFDFPECMMRDNNKIDYVLRIHGSQC